MGAKKIIAGASAAFLAAGAVLMTTPAAQASADATSIATNTADTAGTANTADTATDDGAETKATGLKRFQARHGLEPTGRVDSATATKLRQAPDAELLRTFQTNQDLGPEEKENARTVIGVGKGAEIPEQGIVIALMAGMQESKFVNYTEPVDHDSLGIFQQRPSQGWGTPEQLTDPAYASKLFYGVAPTSSNPGLLQIDGWESMPPGEAAQAVQRSKYPDRYAQWEQWARDFLAAEGPSVEPIP